MTKQEILQTAVRQSAIDLNCKEQDFMDSKNHIVLSSHNAEARKYLELPFSCNLVSYGNNIVASIQEEYRYPVEDYINRYSVEHCFETPNMHVLNDALQDKGLRICFMAEYFLPDPDRLKETCCPYELRVLRQEDFKDLYTAQWR